MRLNLFFFNYLFMMHREIRLSLNIFNSHCLVNGVICTHLWCLGCCVSCRSRCADMWDECWQRRAAGGRIRFQDQTWQKFSQEPFQRLLYPTEIYCWFYCQVTVLLKNKIRCGILLSLEQCKHKTQNAFKERCEAAPLYVEGAGPCRSVFGSQ